MSLASTDITFSRELKPLVVERSSHEVVQGPRFNNTHRVVRQFRRWGNELLSIYEERTKRPNLRSFPVFLNLQHTATCNLRCTMCQQAYDEIPQEVMDIELYRRVRDQFFEGISELSLSVMGEPFCVPKRFFEEILDDVDRYDLRLEMTTNATLFGSDAQLERVARLTTKMVISIDGATRETFEKIRLRGKWDKVVGNLNRLQNARRKLSIHRRPLIYFNYILMKSTLEDFPQFIELAKGWDAHEVRGLPVQVIHPSLSSEVLDPKDPHVQEVLHAAKERAARLKVRIKMWDLDPDLHAPKTLSPLTRICRVLLNAWLLFKPVFTQGPNYLTERALYGVHKAPRECDFLWNKVYVLLNGNASTCCHPKFLVTGHLMKQNFVDIWRGQKYQAIRRMLNTDNPAGPCRDCHLLRP